MINYNETKIKLQNKSKKYLCTFWSQIIAFKISQRNFKLIKIEMVLPNVKSPIKFDAPRSAPIYQSAHEEKQQQTSASPVR